MPAAFVAVVSMLHISPRDPLHDTIGPSMTGAGRGGPAPRDTRARLGTASLRHRAAAALPRRTGGGRGARAARPLSQEAQFAGAGRAQRQCRQTGAAASLGALQLI